MSYTDSVRAARIVIENDPLLMGSVIEMHREIVELGGIKGGGLGYFIQRAASLVESIKLDMFPEWANVGRGHVCYALAEILREMD